MPEEEQEPGLLEWANNATAQKHEVGRSEGKEMPGLWKEFKATWEFGESLFSK